MMEAGAHLRTDEELQNEMAKRADISPGYAHIVPVQPKLVPRDESGAVNLHRPYIDEIELEVEGKTYKRIGDVFDCWFESGAMPFAQIHYPFENKEIFDKNYPADFIAEGLDQTRGWFYSLINLGVGLFDKAPYKHVIVSGLVMAESGLKLSKSEKNYTDPMELVEKYGADSIRYFLLASPVVKGENVLFSDKSVEDVYKKVIMRLENVLSLYEMNKDIGVGPNDKSTNALDQWIMSRINEVVAQATKGYDTYMLDEATYPIDQFVADLSVWYVRRNRDRLKGDIGAEDKQVAYETLTYVLLTLSKVLAPVMPFTAERVYKAMGGERESVHLESWPIGGKIDEDLIKEMKDVRNIVTEALSLRTASKIGVRQPLQKITLKENIKNEYQEILKEELNIKEIAFDDSLTETCMLDTAITEELKSEGDVRNLMRAVQDARKEKGLTPKDTIVLITNYQVPTQYNSLLMNTCKISKIEGGEGLYTAELSNGKISFDIR
jgi:isoleucyl-tRNA synthetase